MSTMALVGLLWVCSGLGALVLGRAFEDMGVRKYARFHPGKDVEQYRWRRQVLPRRIFVTLALSLGAAVMIYGLLFPGK